MVVSNEAQLEQAMNLVLKTAIENTMERALEKLRELIEQEVYSYQSEGAWNNRTGQFKQSWDYSKPILLDNWVQSTLDNASFNFVWNPERDNWSHGNSTDAIDNLLLDKVINDRNGGNDFNFPNLRRPYWTLFQTWYDANIEMIFMQECQKLGLNIVSDVLSTSSVSEYVPQ